MFGVIAGNEPAGGHVGIVSNGEPVPAGGTARRNAFGISSGLTFERALGIESDLECGTRFGIEVNWSFDGCPNSPVADVWPSGIACHCTEFGTFALGGGPTMSGAFGFGCAEVGVPFQRFAPLGCE